MAKSKKKPAAKKVSKKVAKKAAKKAKKTYTHHPDHYNRSESFLTDDLPEDLRDAWIKLREFGESLGAQRIYASGRAIMFSRKVCYFFVRPKKSYLETVIFLQAKKSPLQFKITEATKTKWAHTFKLLHPDQVEGELTDAIAEAYAQTPA